MRRWTTILCAAIAFTACDKQAPPNDGAAATATQTAAAKTTAPPPADDAADEAPAAAAVIIPGTPHDEEHAKVMLSWATDGEVALYKSAGVVSKASARLTSNKGESFEYGKSVVMVSEPPVVTAKEGAKLFEAGTFDPSSGSTAEASRDIDLEAGTEVSVLKYAGEGYCYVGVASDYYLSACPQPEQFDGEDAAFKGPAAKDFDWWVMVETGGHSGWLKVGDKVKVDVESGM